VDTYEQWRLIFDVGKWNAIAVGDEAAREAPEDVDIHRRGDELLVYAPSKERIREAERLVARLLEQRGMTTASTLTRWNPGGERWQDPSLPVEPSRRAIGPEWAALGELGWEVRVRSQDAKEPRGLAQEMLDAGRPTITGLGNRITVGASSHEEALALADELRLRAPTARIEIRPLSRWRRWLIRQRLVGNYASGGGDGGDFGGGGGDGGG
jgi:hypothetical protein